MSESVTPAKPARKKGGFFSNLVFNIIIPVVILSKFSGDAHLGPMWALVVALAFPVIYGCWDFVQSDKVNFFSVLGVISVLLTGGIGLLQLDPAYIAIKEAAVPAVLGIAVILTHNTRYSLVRKLLLNDDLIRTDKLAAALAAKQATEQFEQKVQISTYLLASSFALSAVLNYVLAKWIVVSPAGTEAFNAEIGRMTALSFPVIAIPCTIIMMGAVLYLFSQIGKLTGEELDQFLVGAPES